MRAMLVSYPNPDEPELKIANLIFSDIALLCPDFKLIRRLPARRAQSLQLGERRTLNIQYSIENIQSLPNNENIPTRFFAP